MKFASILLVVILGMTASANASIIGYSVDSSGAPNLYQVDLTTGTSTIVGGTGLSTTGDIEFEGLAFLGDTLYAGVDSVTGTPIAGTTAQSLYRIDIGSGVATHVGEFGTAVVDFGMASDGTTLFLNDRSTKSLYSVNTGNGTLSLIGASFEGDAIAYFDNTLYGIQFSEDALTNQLVSINTVTGSATSLFDLSVPAGTSFTRTGLTATADALYLLGVNLDEDGLLWQVDLAGETLVDVGMTLTASNLAFNAGDPNPGPPDGPVVPEPSSLSVFAGLGLTAGLGFWRRRRKATKQLPA